MPCDFETSPGFLIDRNAHMLRQLVKRTVSGSGFDITTEELAVLVALEIEDGRRGGDLAELLMRDATTVTRQVEGLERKGFVERRASEADRRVVEVFRTEKGRACFNELDPILDAKRDAVLAGITESELEILVHCLRTMRENLRNQL